MPTFIPQLRHPCYWRGGSVLQSLSTYLITCTPLLLPPLQVIQRMGHWLLDVLGTSYITPAFAPEAMLSLAYWPGAVQKDFGNFWAERFCVAFPNRLIYWLMPQLERLEEQVAAAKEAAAAAAAGTDAGASAGTAKGRSKVSRAASVRGHKDKDAAAREKLARVLRAGMMVVLQDGLEKAEEYPDNPVYSHLLKNAEYR